MAKLGRLVWADGMSFTAYGVRFGLRVNDRAILPHLIARLPPSTRPSPVRGVNHLYSLTGFSNGAKGRIHRLNIGYWNLFRFARTRQFEDLLEQFESHVQLT